MAKKSTKRRSLKGRKSRKSPRRGMGSVTCSRVAGKTVCRPTLSGVKRKSSKGKRKGGLAGKARRVKGSLKGLGSVTCARTAYGYNCKKA